MQNGHENNKIASIYEKMMNGDSSALGDLQRI